MNQFSGIKGMEGKEPIGVVATVGHKGPSGAPTDTDRFFLVSPSAEKVGQVEVRKQHPLFKRFNEHEDLGVRQVLRGQIVHATVGECFEHHLSAQMLPKIAAHPSRAPHCTGDGLRASRWNGSEFVAIPCPHDMCEFRQEDKSGKRACGAFARVLFRLRWPEGNPLPSLLCKLTTKSWNSVRAFKGFFDEVTQQAKILGGGDDEAGIYGVQFVITLSKKSIASRQRAFPVMSISVDGDLQSFFVQRAGWLRQVRSGGVRPLAALTDGEQQDPREVGADVQSITPGLPAEVLG